MSWMQTHTGVAFDLVTPNPDAVRVEDIAFALSNINRYTGHGGTYSVAEHCCHVSDYLYGTFGDRKLALAGLLHDAHESYVGDLSSPVQWALGKEFGERWKRFQKNIDSAILRGLGLTDDLHNPTIDLYDARVKDADFRILNDERAVLLGPEPAPWVCSGVEPLGVTIMRLGPKGAYDAFMSRFNDLVEAIQ